MRTAITSLFGALIAAQAAVATANAEELNLYTTREPKLVEPLLASFTEKTGITVNTIFLKDGMPERVEQEGDASPADVLMTVDIGNLSDLVDRGLTQLVRAGWLRRAAGIVLGDFSMDDDPAAVEAVLRQLAELFPITHAPLY